jgi:DNA-binding transcriptional regulator YhcF (GntR family)
MLNFWEDKREIRKVVENFIQELRDRGASEEEIAESLKGLLEEVKSWNAAN